MSTLVKTLVLVTAALTASTALAEQKCAGHYLPFRAGPSAPQASGAAKGFTFEVHGYSRNVRYDGKYVSTDHASTGWDGRKIWGSNESGYQSKR